jgi:hypothetical protein
MSNLISWIGDNWVEILAFWGGLCIVVDAIVGWTKTSADDAIWKKIKDAVQSIIKLNPFSKKNG